MHGRASLQIVKSSFVLMFFCPTLPIFQLNPYLCPSLNLSFQLQEFQAVFTLFTGFVTTADSIDDSRIIIGRIR